LQGKTIGTKLPSGVVGSHEAVIFVGLFIELHQWPPGPRLDSLDDTCAFVSCKVLHC